MPFIQEIHELKDQIQDVEAKHMQNLKDLKVYIWLRQYLQEFDFYYILILIFNWSVKETAVHICAVWFLDNQVCGLPNIR